MSLETKAKLKPETLSKLQELIRANIDAILQKQYARVKAGHDRIRDRRDMYSNRK